jgi:hypothetical protein
MQRLMSHMMMVLWSPSGTGFTSIRPLMNSRHTVSGACEASSSKSSTGI